MVNELQLSHDRITGEIEIKTKTFGMWKKKNFLIIISDRTFEIKRTSKKEKKEKDMKDS
jgi:hypothetical protein